MGRALACEDTAAAETAARALRRDGVVVGERADPSLRPGIAAWVVVDDVETARTAVRSALAGCDLVVERGADQRAWQVLLEDLRRLGPLEHVRAGSGDDGGPLLPAETTALLAHLAAGSPLVEAARRSGMSRRTADRRLAEARRAFAVDTTVELVVAIRRAGAG